MVAYFPLLSLCTEFFNESPFCHHFLKALYIVIFSCPLNLISYTNITKYLTIRVFGLLFFEILFTCLKEWWRKRKMGRKGRRLRERDLTFWFTPQMQNANIMVQKCYLWHWQLISSQQLHFPIQFPANESGKAAESALFEPLPVWNSWILV